MEIQRKIAQLMENDEFRAAFEKVTTPDEVVDLFGKNGIEVPLEIAEELFKPVIGEDTELSEDTLDDVSGGGFGSILGTAIGKAVGYSAGYLGGRLAGWNKEQSRNYAKNCSDVGGTIGAVLGAIVGG